MSVYTKVIAVVSDNSLRILYYSCRAPRAIACGAAAVGGRRTSDAAARAAEQVLRRRVIGRDAAPGHIRPPPCVNNTNFYILLSFEGPLHSFQQPSLAHFEKSFPKAEQFRTRAEIFFKNEVTFKLKKSGESELNLYYASEHVFNRAFPWRLLFFYIKVVRQHNRKMSCMYVTAPIAEVCIV